MRPSKARRRLLARLLIGWKAKAVQPVVGDTTAGMSVTLNIEVVRKNLFGDD
jgi:hypothetical protein